jgi:hypothetical protein
MNGLTLLKQLLPLSILLLAAGCEGDQCRETFYMFPVSPTNYDGVSPGAAVSPDIEVHLVKHETCDDGFRLLPPVVSDPKGVLVEWTVIQGGGAISENQTRTDANGRTRVRWTSGAGGPQRLRAMQSYYVTWHQRTIENVVTFEAMVVQPPGLRVTLSPADLQLTRGASAPVTVRLERTGAVGAVSVSMTPAGGVSASPATQEVSGESATLTVSAGTTAVIGIRDLVVTATAAGLAPATAVLRVQVASVVLAPIVIADTAFLADHWSIFQAVPTNGGSHTAERATDGGNPGGFRLMKHTLPLAPAGSNPAFSAINVRHRYVGPGGEYSPASAQGGAIDRIDVRMDRRVSFATSGSGGAVGHGFLLFQNGVIYWADLGSFTNTAWQTREITGLKATDFVNSSGQHPDFSATAPPVTFGYLRSNSNSGNQIPIELHHGIDSWGVTIHRASN